MDYARNNSRTSFSSENIFLPQRPLLWFLRGQKIDQNRLEEGMVEIKKIKPFSAKIFFFCFFVGSMFQLIFKGTAKKIWKIVDKTEKFQLILATHIWRSSVN